MRLVSRRANGLLRVPGENDGDGARMPDDLFGIMAKGAAHLVQRPS